MNTRINNFSPENIHFTLLIILSCLIISILFIALTFVWNKYESNRKIRDEKYNESAIKIQQKNNTLFIDNKINELFQKYEKYSEAIKNETEIINVSKINNELKSLINEITNSSKYKSLLEDEENEIYEKSKFLLVLAEVNASMWEKKFGNDIRRLYGK